MSDDFAFMPWTEPDADPVRDLQGFIEQALSRPFLVKIKVTRAVYDRLRRCVEPELVAWGRPIDWLIAHNWGTPIEVDDTLPSDPGWEAVWSE